VIETHGSAPVVDWFATSATLGLVFCIWHTWHYDGWRYVYPSFGFGSASQRGETDDRCFVFKKTDWFRTTMIWVHLVGLIFFVISRWMDVHVVYQEVSPFVMVNMRSL
jgi:hypothetical protein